MRSFRVTLADSGEAVRFGRDTWTDLVVLSCRGCEEAKGVASPATEFVPDDLKVGATLTCPYCAEESIVPKKARWS